MSRNLSEVSRAYLARVIDPLARVLVRAGVPADAVTVAGLLGVLLGSLVFVVRGAILPGLVVITLSMLTDMLDGAMARARGAPGRFGGFLDSTVDRVADGAVFGSLAYWLATSGRHQAAAAALTCLVMGQVVSYARARAEAAGVRCEVGIAERSERLLLLCLGGIAWLLGVPYAFEVTLWLIAVLSAYTVWQRVAHVWRAVRADQTEPTGGQAETAGASAEGTGAAEGSDVAAPASTPSRGTTGDTGGG